MDLQQGACIVRTSVGGRATVRFPQETFHGSTLGPKENREQITSLQGLSIEKIWTTENLLEIEAS
jgi:hypothetical protein